MSKISVLILTKNEEENIGDCIKSVRQLADEIIVIDAESSDKTVEIGKGLGAKVFIHPFIDFANQRNFALSLAKEEWVLYIDADERVTPKLIESINHRVQTRGKTKTVAYRVKRKNFYLGNHEWPYIETIKRLFRKDKLNRWYGKLHESPIINGEIGEADGFLLHYTHRDLSSMLKKTIEWSQVEAELRFKAGHPKMTWWRFLRVMAGEFFNYYIKQQGFRAGTVGLIESLYQAFSIFITYARLWELQKR